MAQSPSRRSSRTRTGSLEDIDHFKKGLGRFLGGPGETRETVEESLAFASSLRLDALRVTVGIRIYPSTTLAERAVREGLVRSGDDLLLPTFYLAPGLEPWIQERVAGFGS